MCKNDTLEQSGDPEPIGCLTLVSNLLWGVLNRGLDILDNLTKLNITKYQAAFGEFSIQRTLKKYTNNC